jgi:ribonuclease VapC
VIVIDTSALMAIALKERREPEILACIEQAPAVAISAATLAECLIVASRRGIRPEMERTLGAIPLVVVPLSEDDAHAAADAHDRWGRGVHPAGLNFGDCFAYALAKARGWPLLFVGDDFARTDLAPAIST